jgi:hypothetical protein
MKNLFFIIIFIVLAICVNPIMASEPSARSYIWSCSDSLLDSGINYYERLEKILLENSNSNSSNHWIRVVVIPAFESEWAITINLDNAQLEYREAERNIWHANFVPIQGEEGKTYQWWSKDLISVPASSNFSVVSLKTSGLLDQVWHQLHGWLDDERVAGCDGVIYNFTLSQSNQDAECLETWSPPNGTIGNSLATISKLLKDLALSTNDVERSYFEQKTRKEAESILMRVSKSLGK